MPEAIHVPVQGGELPPSAPAQAPINPPQNAVPGFAPPPPLPSGAIQSGSQGQPAAPAALPAVNPGILNPQPTGDAGTDPLTNTLTQVFMTVGAGVDMERAIGKALEYGNPALIDLAYIAEKGGAAATQLQAVARALVDRVQEQTTSATQAAHAAAGGKAQWDSAAAIFDAQAPVYLKQVILQMLSSGNRESIESASKMVLNHVQANGLTVQHATLVQGGAGASGAGALSKEEFQAAHSKLDPNSRTYLADRSALHAQRLLGKQLGK